MEVDEVDGWIRDRVDDLALTLVADGSDIVSVGLMMISSGASALLIERGPKQAAEILRQAADRIEQKAN